METGLRLSLCRIPTVPLFLDNLARNLVSLPDFWRSKTIIVSRLARTLIIGSVAIGSAVISVGALAASAEEITVTGTREAERRFDAPESTGVISGVDIAEAYVTHPSEIFERIPGVHMAWLNGDHHTAVIRQPINFNPLYLYLENGVPTRPTGFFETNALFDVNVPQARSLEVTKGPGTALYGSDAIAGVINVVTPLPTEDFRGSASIEGSTRGYFRGLFSAGGRSGKHGFRGDLNFAQDDGWRDNNRSDRQLGTFTWTFNPNPEFSIRNVLLLAQVDQDSSGSNLNPDDFKNNPKKNRTPISFREVDSVRFHSIMEYKLDEALLSATPYFRYNRVQLLPFFSLGFDPHTEDAKSRSVGVQLKYRRDVFATFRFIAGVDIDYTSGDRTDVAITPVEVGDIFESFIPGAVVYDFDVDYISISPYLHGEWQATERLRITVGLRFDYNEYDYQNNLSDVMTPGVLHKRPASQSVDFDHFTPKAGFTYDLTEAINAFFSYRQGFRIPTGSQLFRPGRSDQSTTLMPVKAESFEVGIRGDASEWLSFEVSAYQMTNRDDILVFTDNATGVRQIENSGKTRHRGIEIGITVEISEEWLLTGAYAYNDHYFVSWMPTPGTDLSGNDINRAPRDIGNARIVWRPPFLGGGRIEIEYQHLGAYFLDDNNTRKYGGHDLLHIRANYKVDDRYNLFIRIHNLFDKRYATNGRFNAFAGEELKPGLPRTLFGGIGAEF